MIVAPESSHRGPAIILHSWYREKRGHPVTFTPRLGYDTRQTHGWIAPLRPGLRMTDQAQPPQPSATPDVWTVRRVLEWTTGHLKKHGSDTPRLDAEILLAHARRCPRIKLYTEYDQPLSDAVRAEMKDLVKRRAAREPVAYLVGFREFFSLPFRVTKDVLIPRPDTETLVVEALRLVRPLETSPQVLDLCTGSGCIAIAIAKNAAQAQVTGVDISPAALAIAQDNAETLGVIERTTWREGDLFQPLASDNRFDLIVSNPPYIRDDELATLDADVRQYEPRLALAGGTDGLDLVLRLLSEAPLWLKPGGTLLLEIDPQQFPAVNVIAAQTTAYQEVRAIKDLNGQPRVWAAVSVA